MAGKRSAFSVGSLFLYLCMFCVGACLGGYYFQHDFFHLFK